MKSIVKLNLLIIIFISAITVNAQTKVKLGYVNSDSLMLIMPGVDSANQVLQLDYKTYQSQLTTMQTELNTKYQDYQTNLSTMSELIKQTKITTIEAFIILFSFYLHFPFLKVLFSIFRTAVSLKYQ